MEVNGRSAADQTITSEETPPMSACLITTGLTALQHNYA